MTTIHGIGPRHTPETHEQWLKGKGPTLSLLLVSLMAVGIAGTVGYNSAFLKETPTTARVVEEVQYKLWTGNARNTPHNVVTLEIMEGPDKGKTGNAYFYFQRNAKEFKKDMVVDVNYGVRRLSKKIVLDDLVVRQPKP